MNENREIVVVGNCGVAGTIYLLESRREELNHHFPPFFLNQVAALEDLPRLDLEFAKGDYDIESATKRGILGALWDLKRKRNIGITFELTAIPVFQEVIELTEYFHMNPYCLLSKDVSVILTLDAPSILSMAHDAGVTAAIIGRTNDSKQIMDISFENPRYITKNPRASL